MSHRRVAGKTVVFTLMLNAVKVKKLPNLDDEFAKAVGRPRNIQKADGSTTTIDYSDGTIAQIDIVETLRPLTKWNTHVETAAVIPEVIRKAFKLAEAEKPGGSSRATGRSSSPDPTFSFV